MHKGVMSDINLWTEMNISQNTPNFPLHIRSNNYRIRKAELLSLEKSKVNDSLYFQFYIYNFRVVNFRRVQNG